MDNRQFEFILVLWLKVRHHITTMTSAQTHLTVTSNDTQSTMNYYSPTHRHTGSSSVAAASTAYAVATTSGQIASSEQPITTSPQRTPTAKGGTTSRTPTTAPTPTSLPVWLETYVLKLALPIVLLLIIIIPIVIYLCQRHSLKKLKAKNTRKELELEETRSMNGSINGSIASRSSRRE